MSSKTLCFGELLLRLTPPNHLRLPQTSLLEVQFTGSEANVAVALSHFGVPTSFVTRVPDNDVGKMGLGLLKKYGVDTQSCVFGGERLGLFYLEQGVGQRASKVLYDRSYSSLATIEGGQIDWATVFEGVSWFHWSGITPAISQAAADETLTALKIAKSLNIKVSCDLNYRASLWRYGKDPSVIMPELVSYCDVLLGDGDTIRTYFGIDEKYYTLLAKRTVKAFPNLQYLALTARQAFHASHNTYQGFLFDKKTLYTSQQHNIEAILDRLGTGDAFMAGLIYCLQKSDTSPQDAVEFAAASAVLNHTIYGDFNLITEGEVLAVINGNTGGKVIR
jgi:2-dehydro-3-deoxygluconokinase